MGHTTGHERNDAARIRRKNVPFTIAVINRRRQIRWPRLCQVKYSETKNKQNRITSERKM